MEITEIKPEELTSTNHQPESTPSTEVKEEIKTETTTNAEDNSTSTVTPSISTPSKSQTEFIDVPLNSAASLDEIRVLPGTDRTNGTPNNGNQTTGITASLSSTLSNASYYTTEALSNLDSIFQYTKQTVLDKIGRGKVTDDPEIKTKLNDLNEVKAQYEELTRLGNKFVGQFSALSETMDELGMRMVAMAVREKEAHSLKKVGECYRNIAKNNENYLTSVQMYYSNVEHFQDKVLADTLETAKRYEQLKYEYETNPEYAVIKENPSIQGSPKFIQLKEKYEQAKESLEVKIDTLNMKRQSDMEFQMGAYLKNLSAYYSNSLFLINNTLTSTSGLVNSAPTTFSPVVSRAAASVDPSFGVIERSSSSYDLQSNSENPKEEVETNL